MKTIVVSLQYSNAQKRLVVLAQMSRLVDIVTLRLVYPGPSAKSYGRTTVLKLIHHVVEDL